MKRADISDLGYGVSLRTAWATDAGLALLAGGQS